jgi:hypothetical protein
MNRWLYIVLALGAVGLGAWVVLGMPGTEPDYSHITSFEKCAAAGYPILDSHPRQCQTPDGRIFVDRIVVPPQPEPEPTIKPETARGQIKGYVHVGPTCPVERFPADPNCADRPYSVRIEIHYPNERLHSIIKSGADGNFSATLPIGDYIVRPQAAEVMPSCPEERVTVTKDNITEIDISCDSGIR